MNLLGQQRNIGAISILSGILALACILSSVVAANYNMDAMADPLLILSTPGTSADAARWSMILDMFGYYLLLLPVIYLLHDWMRTRSAWSNLITFCGLAYVLIGGIGASVLAVGWPKIMAAYPLATAAEQQVLKANFSLLNDMVYGSMWNLLEMLFAAAWWGFTGYLLLKSRYKAMGWLTIVTGISCLGDSISGILQTAWLHELTLNLYLVLAIVWAFVMGIFLVRRRLK